MMMLIDLQLDPWTQSDDYWMYKDYFDQFIKKHMKLWR